MTTRTIPLGRDLLKISEGLNCSNTAKTKSIVRFAYNDVLDGVKNPSWRQQIRLGVQAGTPMSGYRVRLREHGSSLESFWKTDCKPPSPALDTPGYEYLTGGGWLTVLGDSPQDRLSQSLSPVVSADTRSQALGKFYRNARSAQVSLQGLVAAGELAQTLRLIRSPLRSVYNGIRGYLHELKRARGTPRPRLKSIIAETWLEWSFGWKPLLSDIEGGCELLAHRLHNLAEPTKRIKGFSALEALVAPDTYHNVTGPQAVITWRVMRHRETKASARYFGAVKASTLGANSAGSLLARRAGLTPDNWLPSLYELIPWSFVVDYFSNLGEIVNALAYHDSNLAWWMLTERQTMLTRYGVSKPLVPLNREAYAMGDLRAVEITSAVIRRSIPLSLGVPAFFFKIPGLSMKWLNLTALYLQLGNTTKALRL